MNSDKYYFNYEVKSDIITYQLKNHNSSITNLISSIDQDTLFDFSVYYDDKYNDILADYQADYQAKLELYITNNNITITKTSKDLSYQLLLLLLSYNQFLMTIMYTYDELKNKIQRNITDNFFISDNFYISDIFTFYKKNEYIENKLTDEKPKYLIFKSFNGFGDRLQCLLYAMNYCLITQRILVIDWTDDTWSTNDKYDFDYYFTLKDILTMKLNDFKTLYNDNQTLTVYPKFWKNNVFTKNITNLNDTCLQNQNTILNNICQNKSDDFKEDIIIYTGYRYRYYYYYLFSKHFVFNDIILNDIYQTDFYKNIISKNINYCVIHLRGGDRMIESDDSNSILWDNNSIHENEYVDALIQQVDNSYQTILLLSDTISLIDNCYSKLKDDKSYTIYMTNNTKQNNNEGLHKQKDFSKLQINLEMLADFYFMVKADKIINDDSSTFSNVCKQISYY